MSDTQSTPVLPRLIEIARLDVLLNGLAGQLKVLENDLAARKLSISQHESKRANKTKALEDRRSSISREEKSIKLERDKINDRRRALATLSTYKLQQAGEREIDFVSKQIGKREDLLLTVMREVELLEKEIAEIDAALESMRAELSGFEKEAGETSTTLNQRVTEYTVERKEHLSGIEGDPALVQYARCLTRYPANPIAEVANRESCSGCYVRVGPQVFVQISRGDVVKCPGCGRLLRLPVEQ